MECPTATDQSKGKKFLKSMDDPPAAAATVVGDESYFIKKAKTAQHSDQYTAKAWILAAKTLFPNNFDIQFEVYVQEKVARNHLEAAKCFSHIVLTFPTPPPELWREITQLTSALRVAEENLTADDEFYVQIFEHISYEVQNKILSSLNTENNLDHCKFVLLLLKKYPQAVQVHLPRLLEALVQNNSVGNQQTFIKMLLLEVVPLIVQKPPQDLSPILVHRIMTLGLEFYTSQMFLFNNAAIVPAEFGDTVNLTTPVCWKRIFEIEEMCGQMLKWDPFLPYNATWSKDVYWQKLLQIVSSATLRPAENKQILFYSTMLFILSLQEYINGLKHKIDDIDIRYVLIEGFSDEIDPNTAHRIYMEPPSISSNPPCDKEVPIAFRTAVQCWQLLHSNEILQLDFKQLLLSLPCSTYVNQFLVDLAFYVGQPEEAQTILSDSTLCSSNLEKNLRYLSLTLHQPTFKVQAFDFLLKILPELPSIVGNWMQDLSTSDAGRHVIFLPLTKRAILQYCVKILVNALKPKIEESQQCSDTILGNQLVLLQLNYPAERDEAEMIFDRIRSKHSFVNFNFASYIVCPDFLEEFMHLYLHDSEIRLELAAPTAASTTRRIGTRGADKGVKDDFKQLIRKQFLRSGDDIEALIVQFITQEHLSLVQNIFDK